MADSIFCENCGAELSYSGFGYQKDICWDCFKRDFQILREWAEDPSHNMGYSLKTMLDFLYALASEKYVNYRYSGEKTNTQRGIYKGYQVSDEMKEQDDKK